MPLRALTAKTDDELRVLVNDMVFDHIIQPLTEKRKGEGVDDSDFADGWYVTLTDGRSISIDVTIGRD